MPCADLIGQTLGNYRIESLLGSGGMGCVFRAVHVHLGQSAAIKVLHPALAIEVDFRARFLQEARAAASLEHTNIIQIKDFGELHEKLYLVMELISGGSLRRLLSERAADRQPSSLQAMADFVKQTADGLAEAHEKGMVHRDIKPENLLLSPNTTGNYTVKITDFGLVRLTDQAGMFSRDVIPGTPAYMSPEQFDGRDLDGRSDLYSLGIVLYEAATGYLPFEAKTLASAMNNQLNVPPAAPSTTQPDFPTNLEKIILRCLEKRPEDRFASALELSGALEAWIQENKTAVPVPVALPIRNDMPIEIALDNRELRIAPGQPAGCKVTIRNTGPIVEAVSVVVDGVDDAWIQGSRRVQLNPGTQASVPLTINVPRVPASRARGYGVTVCAKSDVNQTASSSEQACWTVLPFYAMSLEIAPANARAGKRATYNVTIHNQGNTPVSLSLTSNDDGANLTRVFDIGNSASKARVEMEVQPDAAPVARLSVSAPRHWIGAPISHPIRVRAVSNANQLSSEETALFTHRALLPFWMLPVMLLVLGGAVWLFMILMKPEIPNMTIIQTGKTIPIGELIWGKPPIKVKFSAKRARTFKVQVQGEEVYRSNGDKGEYEFHAGFKHTKVNVVASNFFGSRSPGERDIPVHCHIWDFCHLQ